VQRISSLDLLKFICAVLVVLLHCCIEKGTLVVTPFCRIAVPIFFIISGYLLGRNPGPRKVKKTLFNVLRLIVLSNLLYFLYAWVSESLPALNSMSFWCSELLFGNQFAGHLWYLTAYLEVLLLLFLIPIKRNWIYCLIPGLLIANLLLGEYSFLYSRCFTPFIHRNAITTALPCVLLGTLLREKEEFLKRMDSRKFVPGVTFIVLFMVGESLFLFLSGKNMNQGDIMMSTVPLACAFVVLALRNPNIGKDSIVAFAGKELSLSIYIVHLLVMSILSYYLNNPYMLFAFVLMGSIIASLLFCSIKRVVNKWNTRLP